MIVLPPPHPETSEPVYSNLDHRLDPEVVEELERAEAGTLCAQHAAWDYCGYVWRLTNGRWIDQVWLNGRPERDFIADTLEAAIDLALEEFGRA